MRCVCEASLQNEWSLVVPYSSDRATAALPFRKKTTNDGCRSALGRHQQIYKTSIPPPSPFASRGLTIQWVMGSNWCSVLVVNVLCLRDDSSQVWKIVSTVHTIFSAALSSRSKSDKCAMSVTLFVTSLLYVLSLVLKITTRCPATLITFHSRPCPVSDCADPTFWRVLTVFSSRELVTLHSAHCPVADHEGKRHATEQAPVLRQRRCRTLHPLAKWTLRKKEFRARGIFKEQTLDQVAPVFGAQCLL